MEKDGDVQEYYDLSLKYIQAAKSNMKTGLLEPALFNGIHALELAIKSMLILKIDGPIITHNVGGLFGQYYRDDLGEDVCKEVNKILIRYNIPRYPGMVEYEQDDIKDTIEFIDNLIKNEIFKRIKGK